MKKAEKRPPKLPVPPARPRPPKKQSTQEAL